MTIFEDFLQYYIHEWYNIGAVLAITIAIYLDAIEFP
jgi:hypothetical protein